MTFIDYGVWNPKSTTNQKYNWTTILCFFSKNEKQKAIREKQNRRTKNEEKTKGKKHITEKQKTKTDNKKTKRQKHTKTKNQENVIQKAENEKRDNKKQIVFFFAKFRISAPLSNDWAFFGLLQKFIYGIPGFLKYTSG